MLVLTPDIAANAQEASLTAAFVMFIVSVAITLAMEFLRPKPELEGQRPKPLGEFQFPTATEDRMVPILWGTMDIKGPNVTWFGSLRTTRVRETVSTGLFSSTKITTAIRYFVGLQLVLCYGPIDRVTQMKSQNQVAFSTPTDPSGNDGVLIFINEPGLFGGTNSGGGIRGNFRVYAGTETQNVSVFLDNAVTSPVPAYRGISHIVAEQPFVGEQVQIDPHVWRVTRFPDNLGLTGDNHIVRGTIDDGDANPAEVLYEILTNDTFGLGIAAALINFTSFQDAGEALFTEGNGWSSIQDSKIQGTDLIREVLRQIDGALYEDSGGTWFLKLFRADFVLMDTPIFDETNIVELESFNRQSWSQTQNDIAVTYADRTKNFIDTSVPAQDTANSLIQGKKVRADMSFPGIKHPDLAAEVAARELRVLSFPIAQIRFTANRDAATLRPGDVIRLTWAPLELVEFVVRVMSIDLGSLDEGTVGISGSQDFWQLPEGQTIMAPSEDSAWEDVTIDPVIPSVVKSMDAPRFVNDQVTVPRGSSLGPTAADADRARLMTYAVRGNAVQQNWFITIDPAQTGNWPGWIAGHRWTPVYAPTGLLRDALPIATADVATSLFFDNEDLVSDDIAFSSDELLNGRWILASTADDVLSGRNLLLIEGATQADDEFVAWEDITDLGGGDFRLDNIHRGMMDTRPKNHPAGARIFFSDGFINEFTIVHLSLRTYAVGTTVDVWTAPWTARASARFDTSLLVPAPFTFSERMARPLPPQNTLVDDGTAVRLVVAADLDISGGGSLLTTWEHNIYQPLELRDIDNGSVIDADSDQDIEYDLTFTGRYSGNLWRSVTATQAGTWRQFDWTEATAQSDTGEAGPIPMNLVIKARRSAGAAKNPNLEALQDEFVDTIIDIGGATDQSIDFDGSTEFLRDVTGHLAGLGNAWTFNAWVRPDVNVGGSEREMFTLAPGNNVNRMEFGLDDDANGGAWFARTFTSAQVALKDYRFGSYTSGLWFMVTVTWNGTSMLVYENGSLVTPGSTPIDASGTMTDTTRAVFIGTDDSLTVATRWQGLGYQYGLFSRVLLAAEITSMYSSGTPTDNLLDTFGSYLGAPDLVHLWDFRITDNTGLGQDFGGRPTSLRWNVTDDSLNMTTADLVATVPS